MCCVQRGCVRPSPLHPTSEQHSAFATPFRTVAIVAQARHDLVLARLVGYFADLRGGGGRSAVRRVQRCRVYRTGLGIVLQFTPARAYGSLSISARGGVPIRSARDGGGLRGL